ncbi:MAG: hypothetical protein K4571_10015 [Deltaproteobacteria bacterium]
MGKSMFNYGKNSKEKARQLKQMEKASKRLAAKQNKAQIKSTAPSDDSAAAESGEAADMAKGTA